MKTGILALGINGLRKRQSLKTLAHKVVTKGDQTINKNAVLGKIQAVEGSFCIRIAFLFVL